VSDKLTIKRAVNGYIIKYDGGTYTVTDDDPAHAAYSMLGWVQELIGWSGSRYDEWRPRVSLEHGDKWMSPEEWENEKNTILTMDTLDGMSRATVTDLTNYTDWSNELGGDR